MSYRNSLLTSTNDKIKSTVELIKSDILKGRVMSNYTINVGINGSTTSYECADHAEYMRKIASEYICDFKVDHGIYENSCYLSIVPN